LTTGCKEKYIPKPPAYFRIDFPEKKYQTFDDDYPYRFEYPVYAQVQADRDANTEPYWINVIFPKFKANIHISYKYIEKDADKFFEDCRLLAYKHSIKADAIDETLFENADKNLYALLYEIKGNTASSLQFYATDSIRNYMRGALYFNVYPNKDSLAPVIEFLKKDIIHFIESIEWNKNVKIQKNNLLSKKQGSND
jgi:gliding motility-associated lipoprotein GldD